MRTILVSAMGCAPNSGSEQGVGWNWIMQMAKNNNVHVISVTRRRQEIEANIPAELRSKITFHYFDVFKIVIKILPPATILFYLQYLLWQIGIIPLICKLSKQYKFDYAIHLTFGSIWMPTFLPFFSIPFIWGPIGGAEAVPKSFLKSMNGNFYDSTMQRVRYILIKSISINPFILFPIWRSKAILARTKDTARAIPHRYQHKVRQILETAMESFSCQESRQSKDNGSKIRLLSTGRLVPFKNFIIGIEALGILKNRHDFIYTMIGSGPDKDRLESRVKALGLEMNVEFIDAIPRNEVIKKLNDYDMYLFPSLREGGSWALMEAMALGLPVVCVDTSGMSVITDDNSAIRLKVTNPQQMVEDMTEAIEQLMINPQKREKIGNAARRRMLNEFSWKAKGVFMEQLFNELTNQKDGTKRL